MRAKWKRLMAVLLIVSLVLGFCPDVAEAEEAAQGLPVQTVVNEQEDTGEASGQPAEETTEAITEEITTEAVEETSTEEKTAGSPEEEKTAGGTEQATEQAAEQTKEQENPDGGQEEIPVTEPEKEQPKEDQEVFQTVERHTLYCMEDTRVYEKADTASTVWKELEKGEAFEVTAESDTWYQVIYGIEEEQGYVERQIIRRRI